MSTFAKVGAALLWLPVKAQDEMSCGAGSECYDAGVAADAMLQTRSDRSVKRNCDFSTNDVYLEVLCRKIDPAGEAYWQEECADPRNRMSAAFMAQRLRNGDEYANCVACQNNCEMPEATLAPSTVTEAPMWPQYTEGNNKCHKDCTEATCHVVTDIWHCQKIAMDAGHRFYSYRDSDKQCTTTLDCTLYPVTGDWKVYSLAGTTTTQPATTTEAPAPSPADSQTPLCTGCWESQELECWNLCGEKAGLCDACNSAEGTPGACCMAASSSFHCPSDPDVCKQVPLSRFVGYNYHSCVLTNLPAVAPATPMKGIWTFKLSGSKYTRAWADTVVEARDDETFSVTESGDCGWGYAWLHLTGSKSGELARLSCANQEITIDSQSFEATGPASADVTTPAPQAPAYGIWHFTLKGSRYTQGTWPDFTVAGWSDETFTVTQSGDCGWGYAWLHMTGSKSGNVQQLSCANQEISIVLKEFTPDA